jgi:hypothetical protein
MTQLGRVLAEKADQIQSAIYHLQWARLLFPEGGCPRRRARSPGQDRRASRVEALVHLILGVIGEGIEEARVHCV